MYIQNIFKMNFQKIDECYYLFRYITDFSDEKFEIPIPLEKDPFETTHKYMTPEFDLKINPSRNIIHEKPLNRNMLVYFKDGTHYVKTETNKSKKLLQVLNTEILYEEQTNYILDSSLTDVEEKEDE